MDVLLPRTKRSLYIAPASGPARRGQCGSFPTGTVQEHPLANLLRKQVKSWTLSTGAVVDRSQLAYVSAEANLLRKHVKSWTFRIGDVVEESQLA